MNYVEQFNEDGFCIIPGALSKNLVDRVNKNIDDFLGVNLNKLQKEDLLVCGMLQRVVNLHFSITSLKDVFVDSMEKGGGIVVKYGPGSLYRCLFF